MKVTFPTGRFISPGFREIQTIREVEEEVWHMGHLIETKIHKINESHGVNIPDPGLEPEAFDGEHMPLRGEFTFADRTFIVVRDDDWGFWGWREDGEPKTKDQWFSEVQATANAGLETGVKNGWWSVGADGTPQKPGIKISIADMQSQNKPLMAHLMHDLGFFPSVGQARKNGWDKPLELGRHELGPKKKRAIVEIIE
jgi:hypothetical protein